MTRDYVLRAAPILFAIGFLALWEAVVRLTGVPVYLVPGPVAIGKAFLDADGLLLTSLVSTLVVTFTALVAACVLGVGLVDPGTVSGVRLLRRGPFALLFAGSALNAIGTWATLIALWGYAVETAADGQEALDKLADGTLT